MHAYVLIACNLDQLKPSLENSTQLMNVADAGIKHQSMNAKLFDHISQPTWLSDCLGVRHLNQLLHRTYCPPFKHR